MKMMIIAGLGGFTGTCLRYLISRWSLVTFQCQFPIGTFFVNLIGCFLIGIFSGIAAKTNLLTPTANVLLIAGFCGGFTTFSTFSNDILNLINKGNWATLSLYFLCTVIFGLLLTWLGRSLIR